MAAPEISPDSESPHCNKAATAENPAHSNRYAPAITEAGARTLSLPCGCEVTFA